MTSNFQTSLPFGKQIIKYCLKACLEMYYTARQVQRQVHDSHVASPIAAFTVQCMSYHTAVLHLLSVTDMQTTAKRTFLLLRNTVQYRGFSRSGNQYKEENL